MPTIVWFLGTFLFVIPASRLLARRVFPDDPTIPSLEQSYNRCLALKRRGEGDAGNRSLLAMIEDYSKGQQKRARAKKQRGSIAAAAISKWLLNG